MMLFNQELRRFEQQLRHFNHDIVFVLFTLRTLIECPGFQGK